MALEFLVVDDDDGDRRHVVRTVRAAFPDAVLKTCDGTFDMIAELSHAPDVALIDYRLTPACGLDFMAELHLRFPSVIAIIMTGQGDEEIATSALKAGAADYVPKHKMDERPLRRMVENGLSRRALQAKIDSQRQELEIFADVLIHDLKAPIRSIRFFAEEIAGNLDPAAREAVATELRLLDKASMQIGALLDSLAGHIRMREEQAFERVTIGEVIDAALLGLEINIAESGAQVVVTLPAADLECCAPQLSQMFQNLVGNAIKYAGDTPPRIEITARSVTDTDMVLCVADNGVGIPEEYLERVFDPFKRVPSKNGISGTGLGLATCRKVMTRHGGRIWCESTLGAGAIFFLELPRFHAATQISQRAEIVPGILPLPGTELTQSPPVMLD